MAIRLFSALFVSFVLTFAITPLIIKLARIYGLVDNPLKRLHPAHTHHGIVPRAGGLAVFMGIYLPFFYFITPDIQTSGIITGAAALVLIGLLDDKKDLSPYLRFLVNCLAAILVISAGIRIPYITNPMGGIFNLEQYKIGFSLFGNHSILLVADLFALVWIVWTTNIVGWSGGVDGQLPGFVAISAIIIGLLSLRFVPNDPNQLRVTYLSFLTAGAFLGFLPWNFYPQKIMPGYGGKSLAGFMLAVLSILAFSKLGTALLVLVVPMTDAAFVFIRRSFSGHSPVWASSGHLHHHLLRLGWSKRKISLFYWLLSAAAGIAALTLSSKQKVFVGVLVILMISGFIIWINYLKRLPKSPDKEE